MGSHRYEFLTCLILINLVYLGEDIVPVLVLDLVEVVGEGAQPGDLSWLILID